MALKKGVKHGVVFTLMAIVISSIIVLSLASLSQSSTKETNTDLLRVRVIDGVATGFLEYAEISLRASSQAALTNLSRILSKYPDPNMEIYYESPDNVRLNLERCLTRPDEDIADSTHTFHVVSADGPCLSKNSLDDLLVNYTALVHDTLNIDVEYTFNPDSFVITELVAFELLVSFTINVTVTDDIANFSLVNQEVRAVVPTTGVMDPVTAKFAGNTDFTSGLFTPYVMRETNIVEFNHTSVYDMLQSREFRNVPEAPSAFGRFYGNFTPSTCCGVESFIDSRGLNTGGGMWPYFVPSISSPRSNYSFVDHELFENVGGGAFTPALFKCSDGGPRAEALVDDELGLDTTTHFFVNISTLGRYGVSTRNWTACSP